MPIKIAINGFGRIGRSAAKIILDGHANLDLVAVNDLADPRVLAHLLKYDSNYGIYNKVVSSSDKSIIVDNVEIPCLAEKDPAKLPWKKLGVDIVLECTGLFTDVENADKHLKAGAKKVIISAPSKGETIPHFVLGVNEDKYNKDKDDIISMCSCTTNCLAPIAKVLNDKLGIESGLMTTIHSYTSGQKIQDAPHKDLRRARAIASSLIPTTTGVAIAVIKTLPELKGKIHGIAIRVPTPVVSLVDFTAWVKKNTSQNDVNDLLVEASQTERLKGILDVEDLPLVSVDYKGSPSSAIVDTLSTMVQEKKLVKILAWYDNEWGYACRLAEFTNFIGQNL